MEDIKKEYTDCVAPSSVAEEITTKVMPAKAGYGKIKTLVLSIAAGAFIAFGAQVSMTIMTGTTETLGFGLTKLLGGMIFAAGLIMVVLTGAELFTGNVMMTFSVIEKKMSFWRLMRNWGIVYFGNLVGSLLIACLIYATGLCHNFHEQVGAMAVNTAYMKVNLTFVEAFTRGILCNWLVCMAIWMAFSSKTVIGKIFAIVFPITTFCASGYEHSIANMFFISNGLMEKSVEAVAAASMLSPDQLATLNIKSFLLGNLIPVTLGNIVGAFVFMVLLFWTAYIRPDANAASDVAPHKN